MSSQGVLLVTTVPLTTVPLTTVPLTTVPLTTRPIPTMQTRPMAALPRPLPFGGATGRLGAEALEVALLGEAPSLSREEVARLARVDVDTVSRLWRALGFVDPEPGSPNFTYSDVAALRVVRELLEAGFVTEELTATVARATGQSLSRLAAAQVEVTTDLIGREPGLLALAESNQAAFVEAVVESSQRAIQKVGVLVEHAWRRHLAAVAQRRLSGFLHDLPEAPVAVGFCDIVDFTALTRDLDRSDLGELVESFEVTAYDAVVEGGGRVVKTLGDEVMWTCDSALGAAHIALALADAFGRGSALPPVRVGLAYGPALARAGDVLGPVVNLASRCTTLARPGAVLVDKALADAIEEARARNPDEVDVTVHIVRAHRLRGFGRIATFRLRWVQKADGHEPGDLR